ncbi:hypothetical protein D3C87_677460 [compost metagenome]
MRHIIVQPQRRFEVDELALRVPVQLRNNAVVSHAFPVDHRGRALNEIILLMHPGKRGLHVAEVAFTLEKGGPAIAAEQVFHRQRGASGLTLCSDLVFIHDRAAVAGDEGKRTIRRADGAENRALKIIAIGAAGNIHFPTLVLTCGNQIIGADGAELDLATQRAGIA